jgi:hypothetical protein
LHPRLRFLCLSFLPLSSNFPLLHILPFFTFPSICSS